ncbi:oryzin precursor [Hypomontagnella monticulosa]|nr:oryzin precursor [Hypomontagnella monticulosa]
MVCLVWFALLSVVMTTFTSAQPPVTDGRVGRYHNAGQYIVTLRDGLDASAVEQHIQRASSLHARSNSPMVELGKRWSIGSWNAYSCSMDGDVFTQISRDDAVEFIEPDSAISLAKHITQTNATWGLSAVSHRVMDHTDYVYDSRAGVGTYAYIIDSGLLPSHEEFEGRAHLGYNAIGGEFIDDVGHGTHVAGTIGGKTYGVAKKATLISIKVIGEHGGYTSDLLDGLHWAVANITAEKREQASVISISVGGELRKAVNRAVHEAYLKGVLIVVAAGNLDSDASGFSPASAPNAITVGSIGPDRSRSTYSNWGDLVDIFAPGEDVLSAWIESDESTRILSGTSMATPHISGLILYLKSLIPYRMKTPINSINELRNLATDGVVRDAKGSKNLLGFNGNGVVIFV